MTWQQGNDATRSGRLELMPGGLAFEGTGANGVGEETIQFGDLLDVRVGRSASDRISGRQTLVLERRSGSPSASRASSIPASSPSLPSILDPNSEMPMP